MGIRTFMFSLLIIAISLLVATTVFNQNKKLKSKKLPAITFINSTIYNLNNKEVTEMIISKKAYHYNQYDKLYDATIIVKSLDDTNKSVTDIISSNRVKITDKLFKFRGDVKYNRDSTITLSSQSLDYNRITKDLIGKQKFTTYYNGNKLSGTSLFVNKNHTIFKSKDNTPVKLDIIMKKNLTIKNNIKK
jgi:hypothetical protein